MDDSTMTECSGRDCCKQFRWYHLECVRMDPDDLPFDNDWWCGKACKVYAIFCPCKGYKPDVHMVAWLSAVERHAPGSAAPTVVDHLVCLPEQSTHEP